MVRGSLRVGIFLQRLVVVEADARSHMGKQVVCSVTMLGGLVKDAVVCVVSGRRRPTDEC